jgi:hypothetical protein
MARMRFGMSLIGGSASMSDMEFDGQVEHSEVHNYHYPMGSQANTESAQAGSGGMELQAAGFVSEHVFVGAFGSMEGGGSNAKDRVIDGLTVRPNSLVQFKTGALVGASIPVGKWLLRGDALVGLRSTGLGFESQMGDCVQQSMAWNHDLLVEPRIGIERWINPWLSAGVMVGADAMREQDLNFSIGITGHTTAFDSQGVVALPR